MLEAHITVQVGDLDLKIGLTAAAGETVALLGPNGAGKSTTLRALAGLRPIDGGRIALDSTVLDDPATDTFVPPAARPIGVVFQDYLLFPRMTVLDNVAFGLRHRGRTRSEARVAAGVWLDRLDLAPLAEAKPRQLSGGEAQRVALARTLATEPDLLLLDEPLSALDASARRQVRADLRHDLTAFGGVRVLVTHDPVDAMVMADRLVIIEAGRVIQTGTATEITAHPASRYVADLVGTNLVDATADGTTSLRLPSGATLVAAEPQATGPVAIAIRPQAVALHHQAPDGSPRNAWATTIVGVETDRDRVRVSLGDPLPITAEITAASRAALELVPGSSVWASLKAVDLTVHPR